MIKIDRTKVKAPAILTDPQKRGPKETKRAISNFSSGSPSKFNFTVYSDSTVKDALIDLFNSKCAYCESTFLHVYSGDVEHFRPKGEITEAQPNTQPGYYWLAADWDNLLLSCRNCNQKLKHLIVGSTVKKTMGKMNQFPLANGFKHIQSHLNHPAALIEEDKHRLLIDPCKDDPSEHLYFDDKNGVIKHKTPKGEKSVEVYVLQRTPLVHAREKLLVEIWAQIQRVIEGMENYDRSLEEDTVERQFYFDRILKRELKKLKSYTKPDQEYSAMANQVIDDFFESNIVSKPTANN